MRTAFLIASLLSLGACMDHGSTRTNVNRNPPPPVGNPDSTLVDGGTGSANNGGTGGGNTGGSNTGGSNTGGGNTGGGGGTGGGSPPNGGGGSGGGNNGGGGGGGAPVPEPGTMLLVGTGLAGAAMLRRRRAAKANPS